jgi:broad specificity phosphatase PhoE
MAEVRLVRHGHAAAGFSAAADPGLDDLGRSQAQAMAAVVGPLGPLALVTSPLLRTRQTAAALEEVWSTTATVDDRVAEIPSPTDDLTERGAWLRQAMAGTWADLGPAYEAWRDRLVDTILGFDTDTVVVSHFVAINAVVGRAAGDDRVMHAAIDNCSSTVIDNRGGHITVLELGSMASTEVR